VSVETTDVASVNMAEVTTTQGSASTAVVLDLAAVVAAPPPAVEVAPVAEVTPIWTDAVRQPVMEAVDDGDVVSSDIAATEASLTPHDTVDDAVAAPVAADGEAHAESSAQEVEVAPSHAVGTEHSDTSRSLDVELSAFELREEERVAPPEPIPGLSAEPLMDNAGDASDGSAETPEQREQAAFISEIADVTAEVRAIHAQEACAEVLEKVAARLRAGQIPAAITDARSEAAVLASVLASLLAQRA
jgi:hypothetical protein